MIREPIGFGERAAECARAMIGTPFRHQGRTPGQGVDCIGTVVLALMGAGWFPSNPVTALRNDYGRVPDPSVLLEAITGEAARVDYGSTVPGDLLLLCWDGKKLPQHIAMVSRVDFDGSDGTSPKRYMIHTHQTIGQVAEHWIDPAWPPKLWGCYRLKELMASG